MVMREANPSSSLHCDRSPVSKSPRHTTAARAAVERHTRSAKPSSRRKQFPFTRGAGGERGWVRLRTFRRGAYRQRSVARGADRERAAAKASSPGAVAGPPSVSGCRWHAAGLALCGMERATPPGAPMTSLPESKQRELVERLRKAQDALAARYPGEPGSRQPVHTVYGGAHLFKSDTVKKLGDLA